MRTLRVLSAVLLLFCVAVRSASAKLPMMPLPPQLAAVAARSYLEALLREGRGAFDRGLRVRGLLLDERRFRGTKGESGDRRLSIAPTETSASLSVKEEPSVNARAKDWLVAGVARTVGSQFGVYFGKNLARGDMTGCKLVGVEMHY